MTNPASRKELEKRIAHLEARILENGKALDRLEASRDQYKTLLTAITPDEAMDLANHYSGTIDLLITDVVMPERNGKELSEKLHELCPDLKVLFMSGYTADVIAHRGVLEGGVHLLPKPFSIRELDKKIREILEKP